MLTPLHFRVYHEYTRVKWAAWRGMKNTRTHEIKSPLKGRVSSHLSGNLTWTVLLGPTISRGDSLCTLATILGWAYPRRRSSSRGKLLSRSTQTLSAGGLSAKGRECVVSTHDGQFMWFLDIYGMRGVSEPRGWPPFCYILYKLDTGLMKMRGNSVIEFPPFVYALTVESSNVCGRFN